MGRARSNRSGQGQGLRLAHGQRRALRPAQANAGWGAGFFRPRLEVLENRLYPGDAILGVLALTLGGRVWPPLLRRTRWRAPCGRATGVPAWMLPAVRAIRCR